MKAVPILIILCFPVLLASGQENFSLNFLRDTLTVSKSNTRDIIVPIELTSKIKNNTTFDDYQFKIEIESNSTLPSSDYILDHQPLRLSQFRSKETLYLIIKQDTLEDRERYLMLKLNIKDKNGTSVNDQNFSDKQTLRIIVKPYLKEQDIADGYRVLSYLGTNFDMADGKTKASNLFFATNVFVPPVKNKNKYGFYLSLYGNRTMSRTDTLKNHSQTLMMKPNNDSTYWNYSQTGTDVRTTVSDNIGATITSLRRIKGKENDHLNVYVTTPLEFVWRRLTINRSFGGTTPIDSVIVNGTIPYNVNIDPNISREQSEFDFTVGLGAFIVYETKDLSIRIHKSIGYLGRFHPKNSRPNVPMARSADVYYRGRAWITEAVTGITLQVEVTNQLINPRPYIGVTLSKAFKIKEIGNILSPLTNRD